MMLEKHDLGRIMIPDDGLGPYIMIAELRARMMSESMVSVE